MRILSRNDYKAMAFMYRYGTKPGTGGFTGRPAEYYTETEIQTIIENQLGVKLRQRRDGNYEVISKEAGEA